MMTPSYIQLFLFTFFVCAWQTPGRCTVDESAVKATSSQRCGRMLSEYASSDDGRDFSDDTSSTVTSNDTDSIISDFNEEDEGYLQNYLTSRINRERGERSRREFYDYIGSLDSLDSVGSRRKVLKKVLSHLKKQESFDYDALKDYIDANLEGEQREKMKMLVDELKKYKIKYLHMKSRFKSNMKKFRKKMKKQIMFMILLVPSITSLLVLLWMIISMTMCGPAALACAPALASTVTPGVVGAAAGAAAGAAGAASAAAAISAPAVACGALADVVVSRGVVCCGNICRMIYAPFPLAFL
ncbi:Plasmodium exported protein, unknown function [Plasmodium vivax]|uniref:Uncharacterized protein n=2 Tax=Plasmodium vivax TaxID=5855 RepID=A5KCK4_PLAVS|nr:hypothetical protein PVX_093685 [Plasmodium vivax]EDL42945.1 hypothetical protein PVX_093685 [Plasmodium vivax]KMZ95934.1 hypothetical protein PVMG_04008 [Plasmodium vivax Mauritania I]CAI7717811.1 Plasmodium exported protein, unknown function [Plasmodium vivax]|eukprot:XP_001608607.1 hypothetical protein [Plasmodium vivax Sal-1]